MQAKITIPYQVARPDSAKNSRIKSGRGVGWWQYSITGIPRATTMSELITRRSFATWATGIGMGTAAGLHAADEPPKADPKPPTPVEAPFERDYPPPTFKPSWKKPQINRLLVQDFVIY